MHYKPCQGVKKEKQVASSTNWGLKDNVVPQLMQCLTPTVSFDLFMNNYSGLSLFLFLSLSLSLSLSRTLELSNSRTRKGPTNLVKVEKVRDREHTGKIKIFTNKARELNKGLLGMYETSSLNAQKTFLLKNFKTLYIKLNTFKKFCNISLFKTFQSLVFI